MPDEQHNTPTPPADPFGPQHANCVQILHTLRAYRAAGGGLVESAVMVAALLHVAASGGEGNLGGV